MHYLCEKTNEEVLNARRKERGNNMSLLKTITNIFNNKEKHSGNNYVIGGVDLSTTKDATCTTIIEEKNGVEYVKQYYFIPEIEDTLREYKEEELMKRLTEKPRRVVRVNYENDLYGYRYQTVTES